MDFKVLSELQPTPPLIPPTKAPPQRPRFELLTTPFAEVRRVRQDVLAACRCKEHDVVDYAVV